jgi:hypothetical protein
MSQQAGKVTVDRLKKESNIRYHKTWNTGLSNLMGVYSLFFANSKQYKALQIFNRVLSYIQDDRLNRMFTRPVDGEMTLDYERMMEFDELAQEFRILFGSESLQEGEKRKFSYQDLMVPKPPEPAEDKVYIQRSVPLIYSWGNKPAAYVAFKIGFVYTVTEYVQTPAGAFPIQKQIPMFSWDDPDVRTGRTKSNCVPYAYYQDQKVKLRNELFPLVSKLEAWIAEYLHQEGHSYQAQERVGSTDDNSWVEDVADSDDDGIIDEEMEGANEE